MEHFDNESKLKSYLLLRKKKKPKERLCVLAFSSQTIQVHVLVKGSLNQTKKILPKRYTKGSKDIWEFRGLAKDQLHSVSGDFVGRRSR